MPHNVCLRGPIYTFRCYGVHEAKDAGIIDKLGNNGTHASVSTPFTQCEGLLLEDWIKKLPDAVLIETGRNEITVYRPKSRLVILQQE